MLASPLNQNFTLKPFHEQVAVAHEVYKVVSTRYKSRNDKSPILVRSNYPKRDMNDQTSNNFLNSKSTELKLLTEENEEESPQLKQVTASFDRQIKSIRSIVMPT